MNRIDYTIPYRQREAQADMFHAAMRQKQADHKAMMYKRAYKRAMRRTKIMIKIAGITWAAAAVTLVFLITRI